MTSWRSSVTTKRVLSVMRNSYNSWWKCLHTCDKLPKLGCYKSACRDSACKITCYTHSGTMVQGLLKVVVLAGVLIYFTLPLSVEGVQQGTKWMLSKFVYLLSVNGRGSTSELHVHVRIEDKVLSSCSSACTCCHYIYMQYKLCI